MYGRGRDEVRDDEMIKTTARERADEKSFQGYLSLNEYGKM